jgi:hypothetical protein
MVTGWSGPDAVAGTVGRTGPGAIEAAQVSSVGREDGDPTQSRAGAGQR